MLFDGKKKLLVDVLNFTSENTLDLTEMQFRETSIWQSKFEEEKKVTLPLYKVYFVTNIKLTEETLKQNVKAIIEFDTVDAQHGSVIILEDLLKIFFRNRMYVYFDANGNIVPLENKEEEMMFDKQMDYVDEFTLFFPPVSKSPLINRLISNAKISFPTEDLSCCFGRVVVLASLRRWMFQSINHCMGASEFDESFFRSFLSSYLHRHLKYIYSWIDWKNPIMVKAVTDVFLKVIKLLESQKIRSLDLPRRWIEFTKSLREIKLDNPKEVEEIIKNVRRSEDNLPPGVHLWPGKTVAKYPWQ